jgi:hypothetical protein
VLAETCRLNVNIIHVVTLHNEMDTIKSSTSKFNLLKPAGYLVHQQVEHSKTVYFAKTVFMCSVFISEQTTNFALDNINCLVFITYMKSVYCAVRTGPLTKTVYTYFLKSLNLPRKLL